jgi:YaiO family outer membrane protein
MSRYFGHAVRLISCAGALLAAGPLEAAGGLSPDRSGVGLKPAVATTRYAPALAWQAAAEGDLRYSGVRHVGRFGLGAPEVYGGLYRPFSDSAGAAFELGVIQATPLTPRRYSMLGELQRTFAGGSSFAVGLKYRVYGANEGMREAVPGDHMGYSLFPARPPGAGRDASYQLQFTYQYNRSTTFGLMLGRELETFTAGFEQPGAGPRLSFTGQHWLTPSWALSYDLLSSEPSSFRPQGLRLGVRYRF